MKCLFFNKNKGFCLWNLLGICIYEMNSRFKKNVMSSVVETSAKYYKQIPPLRSE